MPKFTPFTFSVAVNARLTMVGLFYMGWIASTQKKTSKPNVKASELILDQASLVEQRACERESEALNAMFINISDNMACFLDALALASTAETPLVSLMDDEDHQMTLEQITAYLATPRKISNHADQINALHVVLRSLVNAQLSCLACMQLSLAFGDISVFSEGVGAVLIERAYIELATQAITQCNAFYNYCDVIMQKNTSKSGTDRLEQCKALAGEATAFYEGIKHLFNNLVSVAPHMVSCQALVRVAEDNVVAAQHLQEKTKKTNRHTSLYFFSGQDAAHQAAELDTQAPVPTSSTPFLG